ncbi:MAG TPA: TetR family transcriptional regulator [Caulobacteraceae bacterium]|nr:TetR family transcriptional regulator [Caulobacteraceae bacterium]
MTESTALAGPPARYLARRDEILAAASEVLNNQGSRGFTVALVAQKLGLHPPSLTYYFKRRRDLLAACLMDAVDRFDALVTDAQAADGPQARLTRLIAGHIEIQRLARLGQAPALAEFSEIRITPEPNVAPLMAAYRRMFDRLAGLFATPALPWLNGRRRGLYARLLIEQLGWTASWLEPYAPQDYARAAAQLADVLIGGLAAPGRGWPTLAHDDLAAPVVPSAEPSRERFLVAATDLINEQGYHGASVDKISARLGVTKGSFYYHNTDKDDLILACFDRTLDILREGQTRPRAGDGWTRLCAAAASLALYQAAASQGRMLRSYAFAALPPELRQPMGARFHEATSRFAEMIGEGIADGSIRPVDPLIAAQAVMAMVNSSAYLRTWIGDGGPEAVERLYVRPTLMGLFTQL